MVIVLQSFDSIMVPVCEYGEVFIQSGATLYFEIMCSDSQTIDTMRINASKIVKKT